MVIDFAWENAFAEALDEGPSCADCDVYMSKATNDALSDHLYSTIKMEERDRLGLHGVNVYVTHTGMYEVWIDNEVEDGTWEIRGRHEEDAP